MKEGTHKYLSMIILSLILVLLYPFFLLIDLIYWLMEEPQWMKDYLESIKQ